MKKLIMTLMAVLFLGATTGMVFAQAAGTAKPAATSKSHKGGKKKSHSKKPKPAGSASAPASAK